MTSAKATGLFQCPYYIYFLVQRSLVRVECFILIYLAKENYTSLLRGCGTELVVHLIELWLAACGTLAAMSSLSVCPV